MENPIQTFEPNEEGRDFVIGDLHGSLSAFENLLKNLDFNYAKDRMFSVGDLVDRGPDSLGCLGLLRESWFHSALSNHEQMMLEAFRGGYMGQYWFGNGGNWGMETWNVSRSLQAQKAGLSEEQLIITNDDYELIDLLPHVEQLPFLMTVNMEDGKKFHIIHAELPPGVITDSDLSSPGKVMELATQQTSDGDVFLWGRYRFGYFYKADLNKRDKLVRYAKAHLAPPHKNLSHIISGHTIMQRPVTLLGQTNIDTGAYHSYPRPGHSGYSKVPNWAGLTCVELGSWSFYNATPTQFRSVVPFEINRADLGDIDEADPRSNE